MNNPELRRYAWLELGLHRLVAVPVVLGALAAAIMAISGNPFAALAAASLAVFSIITLGWGTMQAYASVIDEVRDRTWDFQRMAAMGPHALAAGKVLGAPLLSWYIGAWCLVIYGLAGWRAGLPHLPQTLVGVVAAALMAHALAVAASALAARTALGVRSRRFGGVLLMLMLLWTLPSLMSLGERDAAGSQTVGWWLLREISVAGFLALNAVMFAAWAGFAAWRAMARELREPAWWWGWPAFAAFIALWLLGLQVPGLPRVGLAEALAAAAAVLVLAGYLGLSLDPVTSVSWARLARLAARGDSPWHQRVPQWVIHALAALAAGALAALWKVADTSLTPQGAAAPMSLALALMMLRDAAIVTCFSLTTRVRKPIALAAFYIAVADVLAPLLASAFGQDALARAAFPFLGADLHRFYPAMGMAAHLAIVLAVLGWRLRARRAARA